MTGLRNNLSVKIKLKKLTRLVKHYRLKCERIKIIIESNDDSASKSALSLFLMACKCF